MHLFRFSRVLADMTRTANAVMLTSDIHSNWAIDLNADPDNPESQPIGAEFLATSIASGWPPPLDMPMKENMTHNPHVHPYDRSDRGYLLHDVSQARWLTDMRVVDTVTDVDATAHSQAKFAVEAGHPGVQCA